MDAHARKHIIFVISCFFVAMFAVGCSEQPINPAQSFNLPIQFVLPANEIQSSYAPTRRAFGDPGGQEPLAKPTHAYIFVIFTQTDESTLIVSRVNTAVSEGDWETQYINGDLCYVYKSIISIMETPKFGLRKSARVYAAMSNVPLKLKFGDTVVDEGDDDTWPDTQEEIESLKFATANYEYNSAIVNIESNLQNVYSSLCKYKPDGETYYGTVTNIASSHPSINLMLYHVASKVDVMWNVQSDVQSKLKVAKIKFKNLYNEDSYLFKPTDNTITGSGTEYEVTNDIGSFWLGREYIYTIPYQEEAGKFVVHVDLTLNNTTPAGEGHGIDNPIYQITQKGVMPVAFAPWVREQITFSNPVTANTVYPPVP